VYLDPRPDGSELDCIYPKNYYAFDTADSVASTGLLNVKSVSRIFEARRLKSLLSKEHPRLIETVFDIGCGDGYHLDIFKSALDGSVRTCGIEMSEKAAKSARSRGHEVECGLFEDFSTDRLMADLVFSSHVIEHVADPRLFLNKSKSLLNHDGIIVIDTPNVDGILRKLFGRHWGGWHTPRHWYLFNPRSISELATQCGLEVVRIDFLPINMYWVWGLHSVLFDRHRRLADKFFDPVGAEKSGISGIVLLAVFQVFELFLKLVTRSTSQMRIVIRPTTKFVEDVGRNT